ncbi:MAG: hypothetical protein Q8R92_01115 [Deltaproteobacteria bacterium]|nr:hypothetical protein [Deltaproteobacteria bacterium]
MFERTMSGDRPGLTRRAFLHRAGLAASLAALARLPAAPAAAALAGAVPGDGVLSERERDILAHIVGRMVHAGGPAPPTDPENAVTTIDSLLGRLDQAVVADLPLALHLFEWGPMAFDFTFTRFTRMTDAQKDASIRCWMTSRLALRRLAFLALRNLSFIGHYAQPAAWKAIGYKGPLIAGGGGL